MKASIQENNRSLNQIFKRFIKGILSESPFRKYFPPQYLYNFTPPQLCFLCQCLEDIRNVEGSVAEIGCSDGASTIFLNKYLDAQQIQKTYYALDTFSGFVDQDIAIEVSRRGKSADMFIGFRSNKQKWFDKTMRTNGFSRVKSVETDVNSYDLKTLGPLSFVLLDVDLYRPIRKCLPELYQVLSPAGIMIVDDCDPQVSQWDGADQAYREFMAELKRSPKVVHKKLGIIKKID